MSQTASSMATIGKHIEPPMIMIASVRAALLQFTWRQWSQLGIAGDVSFHDSWLIDIESLLLFTLYMGRFDPRLMDEVLDWCIANVDTLSVQRLKRLRSSEPGNQVARILSALASVLQERTGSARWQPLQMDNANDPPEPFFLDLDGSPLPLFGASDPHFLSAGFLRSPISLRSLSVTPSIDLPVALILKLRALFGVDPRAEAIAYLMTHQVVGARELARATACASATAHALLKALHAGQFLVGSGREGYALERSRWQAFLLGGLDRPVPEWIAWSVVLPPLVSALETIADGGLGSSYLRSSRWLRLDASLCHAVKGSGLSNPFAIPTGIDEIEHALPERLHRLSMILAGGILP